jgi:hypothetical protein
MRSSKLIRGRALSSHANGWLDLCILLSYKYLILDVELTPVHVAISLSQQALS